MIAYIKKEYGNPPPHTHSHKQNCSQISWDLFLNLVFAHFFCTISFLRVLLSFLFTILYIAFPSANGKLYIIEIKKIIINNFNIINIYMQYDEQNSRFIIKSGILYKLSALHNLFTNL